MFSFELKFKARLQFKVSVSQKLQLAANTLSAESSETLNFSKALQKSSFSLQQAILFKTFLQF